MSQIVQIRLGEDGRLELKTKYDKRVISAIKSLGDHRTWEWDAQGKRWRVAGSRLLDVILVLMKALADEDVEMGISDPLYVITDCPKGHSTRGYLTECSECHSSDMKYRAGVFVPASHEECIARCYDATGDECNCLCLGLCHGIGRCLGPHKESEWGKTIHRRT